MKRLYSLIILTLTLPSMLNAQQLPNAGFENDWVKCKPWTSNKTKKFESTPSNWTISHVIGINLIVVFSGSTKVGNEISGHDSSKAVSIYNSSNSVAIDQIVPGYLTLGTTWSTANTSGKDADGGTFGGIEFKHRPDAISFYYQRSHGTDKPDEKSSVVAYMWKGTYQQADVPGEIASKPKTVTMMDRDRNILGMETPKGGTVNSDGCERIAKINFDLDGDAADWTNRVIPFEYESANTPEKFNVIFSAGDYFSTTPGKNNTLNIDDIKLIYYSRLASLKVNGVRVNGFDPDKYDYTVDAEMPENSNAFVAECMGNSGSSTDRIDLDKKNA